MMSCFQKNFVRFLVCCLFVFPFAVGETQAQDQRETPAKEQEKWEQDEFELKSRTLFDGETLAGWEGNAYWFRVENGAIVAGRQEQQIPHNLFLCTTEIFVDFDLRLEAKLVGKAQNAGVQFRSKRIRGESEVAGYQADMGVLNGKSLWGSLYDESRRKKFLARPTPVPSADPMKHGEWNTIRIRCKDDRIQLFINGVQTVDYTETDSNILRYGVIGLQIHGGPAGEAWYRNIRLRSL
ncbi:hypothetical protein Q31b_49410 [Novipirellula aureliae]|uniref:3-keto-alpha-glucoside-1,2-lyase/3-keto-2-hydroxy-glucal hydratase domain-containing protein n=1 Tax=Novipirellula aureliae TaxID=2527966 RepID=A0A5C6DPD0_9BACT|nr:DUF1080 domain-containing protein [Novipirellula aureliae]TWU36659.1 hypothetical protein Q31b_49410 [Novipirellula aureliae]